MRHATLLTACLAGAARGASVHLCNFTCGEAGWTTCRSEKCTPRLAEDACADGSEAKVSDADLTHPDECREHGATTWVSDVGADGFGAGETREDLLFGSFDERCQVCMGLAWEAVDMARIELRGDGELRALGAGGLCARAAERVAALLPTIRACRLHPRTCEALVDAARGAACPEAWAAMVGGARASVALGVQRQRCGALATLRNGSGVPDALVCAAPRDVKSRVVAIAAVVAAALFALQMTMWQERSRAKPAEPAPKA